MSGKKTSGLLGVTTEVPPVAPEPYRLLMLVKENNKCEIEEWLRKMRDKQARAIVLRNIDKLSRGLGNQKSLQGISELKIDYATGYRVYYAFLDGQTVVVLIGGGDKSSQKDDIKSAKEIWDDFNKSGQPEAALRDWGIAQAPAKPEPKVKEKNDE